jgi:hypothetical protein
VWGTRANTRFFKERRSDMIKELAQIQNEVKVLKGQYNSFGKYKYRSCEDILTAIKPVLLKHGCQLTITDDVIAVGSRIYIKATVTLVDADGNIETTCALARESETKKGMDDSQITGTASSYARKYALSGLLLLDDTKDADTDEYHEQTQQQSKRIPEKRYITPDELSALTLACERSGKTIEQACEACKVESPDKISVSQFYKLMDQCNVA